jgi:hypothetical protein
MTDTPDDYDAGLLNDFGGGNVDWWQDYLRAEIARANEHWRAQYDDQAAWVRDLADRLVAEEAHTAALRARVAELEAENAALKDRAYHLAVAIMGGEDAPGYADSVSTERLVDVSHENRRMWENENFTMRARLAPIAALAGEIAPLHEAATKGPWGIKRMSVKMSIQTHIHQVTDADGYPSAFVPAWLGDGPSDPNAAPEEAAANALLIAALRNGAAAILAAAEAAGGGE